MIHCEDLILELSRPKVTASNIFQYAHMYGTAYVKDTGTIKRIFYIKSASSY